MSKTIDMNSMRRINLFRKITGISTTNCFEYNNMVIYAVPKQLMSKAIGKGASNVRQLVDYLKRKVKIVEMPSGLSGLKDFVAAIVEPLEFSGLEIKEGAVVISGDRQARAMLIGRNRSREEELKNILESGFGISSLRIG